MATSKSNKSAPRYVGRAVIYSGRPDPEWSISEGDAKQLIALWNASEPYSGQSPAPPVLGYRGVFLRDSEQREWFAYGGVVTLKTPQGSELRPDENRQFERLLLASAPQQAIPSQVLDADLRRRSP